MKRYILFIVLIFSASLVSAQVNARLFQYPDVSQDKIVFSYAGDLWLVEKTGGTAYKLSSPKGQEILPKFSPDGNNIAFSANYNGNLDIYTIPVDGGLPQRVTYHPSFDRMSEWMPDGNGILFASSRHSGRQRFSQLFTIGKNSGLAEKLPIPYGEFGAVSEDGNWLVYTPRTRLYRTWKRYRGGMATDIWLFNLKTFESKNITNEEANDELPMWNGKNIFFLSDRGKEKRFNIWVYNLDNKSIKQVTFFEDFDIHFPSIGPGDIVFEAGGDIYLLNLSSLKYNKINIKIITDNITLIPEIKNVSKYISNVTPAPDGSRAIFEARGELFSVPKKDGVILNLTKTSGVAERYPSWSPNGKFLAYWSDESGEYELMLKNLTKDSAAEQLTETGGKYKYHLYWSPDSKKLAFVDNAMNIRIFDIEEKNFTDVDKGLFMYQGALDNFSVSWSSDSRYITYSHGVDNRHNAVFIFDTKANKLNQVTSGFYSDFNPVFDPEGKYLYFLSNRTFSPLYSDLDNTFIYPNSTNIVAVPLTAEIASPLAPKNDEFKVKEEKKEDDDKDGEEKKEEKSVKKEVKIDFAGFESRVVLLPPKAGNYGRLDAVEGKVIYMQFPNSGSGKKDRAIKYFDIKDREEKTVLDNASFYIVTADDKHILAGKEKSFYIVDIKPNQKLKDALPTSGLETTVEPKKEWKQIFTDAWRFERDFFYDPNMHGVDWSSVRKRYGNLVDFAVTRSDLNFIIGEMIAEISSSHTYRGGGDAESPGRKNVGLLGIDWKAENGRYKIAKIISGAEWDAEARSPLAEPGLDVKEGDYILAVNGIELKTDKEPTAAFAGLAGKTVQLTVNSKPDFEGSRKIIVKTLTSESRLRHLAWIEVNRKFVNEKSNGQIGYIYVRSTGIDGQNELIRQFTAQIDKKGLIIDERFNSGGQIPDRFIEMLNRKPLAFWAVRDGQNWQWPPTAHFGPKAMLINGWSGSGGDAFPDYFRKAGLGKLIGMRTWGGLIGISGAPSLIDGGVVTVPTFRMYDPDGKWFKEGHGVDPDIKVVDNPTELAKGNDPQLQKAVEVVLTELKGAPTYPPKQPPFEKR